MVVMGHMGGGLVARSPTSTIDHWSEVIHVYMYMYIVQCLLNFCHRYVASHDSVIHKWFI